MVASISFGRLRTARRYTNSYFKSSRALSVFRINVFEVLSFHLRCRKDTRQNWLPVPLMILCRYFHKLPQCALSEIKCTKRSCTNSRAFIVFVVSAGGLQKFVYPLDTVLVYIASAVIQSRFEFWQ